MMDHLVLQTKYTLNDSTYFKPIDMYAYNNI
jgi:hypothetical protein